MSIRRSIIARNEPAMEVFRALQATYRALRARSDGYIASYDLSRPQFEVLSALGNTSGMTLKELSRRVPVTKGTSGVVVLTARQVARTRATACVRCGRCVDVCPLHLVPTKMALAARHGDWETARRYHLAACCECGCCAYVCPAGIPLVQLMRMGKATMPRE